MPRLNLVLSTDLAHTLDELVKLMPEVDNMSAAIRRAIIESRDKYEILDAYRRLATNDDQR